MNDDDDGEEITIGIAVSVRGVVHWAPFTNSQVCTRDACLRALHRGSGQFLELSCDRRGAQRRDRRATTSSLRVNCLACLACDDSWRVP